MCFEGVDRIISNIFQRHLNREPLLTEWLFYCLSVTYRGLLTLLKVKQFNCVTQLFKQKWKN